VPPLPENQLSQEWDQRHGNLEQPPCIRLARGRCLQVETADVDQLIVGRIQRGQPITMTVEELDRIELKGTVRSLALDPRTTGAGDERYSVVIDLAGWRPSLRPGMTTRISFEM
jgi:hypothetical protein